MKKLVIYYSLSGNTRALSTAIAEAIDADILELKPEKDIKEKGFLKYFWGGKEVVMKKEPKLYPLEKNPNEYDILVIGTPVWAGSFAPAIRTFLNTVKLDNKKLALFCTHEGAKGNIFDNMKKYLGKNYIIDEKEFVKVSKNVINNENMAKEWAKNSILNFKNI